MQAAATGQAAVKGIRPLQSRNRSFTPSQRQLHVCRVGGLPKNSPARLPAPTPCVLLTAILGPVAIAGNFDEGAAQVRRLLDRDRKEMDFEALDKSFGPSTDKATPANASEADVYVDDTPSNSGAKFSTDKTPVSPFGPSGGASPFGTPGTSRKPVIEPMGLSPDMQPADIEQTPWWKKITVTQIVSGC